MLQYILEESERYSVADLAQMAIEGGCGWIDLRLPDRDDADVRELIVPDVLDMCRDAGVFLTVDDRPELARELGLHGVRITNGAAPSAGQPAAVLRESLGPEAVIGVVTPDPSALPSLATADIDYVCVPAGFDAAARKAFMARVRELGVTIPVVAQGDITPDNVAGILAEGFNGVAVSRYITDSDDPVAATARMIQAIGL